MHTTLQKTILCLCIFALLLPTSAARAAESGEGWSFSDDGTLTLTRPSGINDPPYDFDWWQVKTLRLGADVEDFLLCDDVPYLFPEKIWVNPENPYFRVENDLLIDLRENKVVCGQSGIIHAVVPDYVTVIGMGAFARHEDLQTVVLPEGLLVLEDDAFDRCTALREIDLPDSLQWMSSAFWECTALTSITIPAGAEGRMIFDSCTSLTHVTFADGSRVIGEFAFWGCTALTDVRLPDSLRIIQCGAFHGCTSLKTLRIPASLEKVERRAFEGCTQLEMLDFPDGVEIEEDALPYALPTSAPAAAPTSTPDVPSAEVQEFTPTLQPVQETIDPVDAEEARKFGKDQLILTGFAVLIAMTVAAIVIVWKRTKRGR